MRARHPGVLARTLLVAPVVLLLATAITTAITTVTLSTAAVTWAARPLTEAGLPVIAGPDRAPAATVSPAPETLKFYVVGPPTNGTREYLFAIAARTLGDGRRYREIFDLNAGRRQADGGQLTDPNVLAAGWVLLLPDDAAGPGVHIGQRSSFLLAAPVPTAVTPIVPPAGSPGDTDGLLRVMGVAATVALLGVSLRVLRRGDRLDLPRWAHRRAGALPADADGGPAGTGEPAGTEPGPIPARAVVPLASSSLSGTGPLRADVTAAGAVLTVDLTGERGPRPTPGHGWTPSSQAPPPGAAVITIGTGRPGTLWLDLAACPDVVTVSGPLDVGLGQVRDWAGQLTRAGVVVTMVAGRSRTRPPRGCQAVSSLADLLDRPTADHEIEVVVCVAADADDPLVRQRVLAETRPRRVLILVGDSRRSRWSIAVSTDR